MDFFDRLTGDRAGHDQPELDIEGVDGAWTTARTGNGASLAGGRAVLAGAQLVLSPWDMDATRAWLVRWLQPAGWRQGAHFDRLLSVTEPLEPVVIPVANITDVMTLHRASLFRPPQARLRLRDGSYFDFGILASPTTPNPSARNNAAFDDFLSKMRAAAQAG